MGSQPSMAILQLESSDAGERVSVAIRLRPLQSRELDAGLTSCVTVNTENDSVVVGRCRQGCYMGVHAPPVLCSVVQGHAAQQA